MDWDVALDGEATLAVSDREAWAAVEPESRVEIDAGTRSAVYEGSGDVAMSVQRAIELVAEKESAE